MKDVIIIGAGIAGLTAGFELQKSNIDFQILESSDRIGGVIETLKISDCLIETGPNTFSSLSKETLGLVKDLECEDSLIEASPDSKKRYIYINSHLKPVPANPIDFLKTDILSRAGKWTVFEELFIPKEEKEETVEDFFTRRFGREVLKNLIQPYLNGVFAGDVKKLSTSAVFPKLKELENKHKSVLLGFILSKQFKQAEKLTLYSFEEGMEFLPNEIYKKIKTKVTLNAKNIEITRAKDCFIVTFKINNKTINYPANSVLFAIPAYKVLDYNHLFPHHYLTEIFHTEYLPLCVASQIVDKSKLKFDLDGFGFLCTKEPHRKLLGTIWNSSIFSKRAPANKVLMTSYMGGAYHKKVIDQTEDEIKTLFTKELCETLHISDHNSLETLNIKIHTHAIPQYNLGHTEKVNRVIEFMSKGYGLFFCGNYFSGISINDTVKTSKEVTEKIKIFLNTQTKKKEVTV